MLPIWKLLGFILYVIIYFSTSESYDAWPEPSIKSAFFKVLPIMHCILIVISTSWEEVNLNKSQDYRNNVLLGLTASMFGDVVFLWHRKYVIIGMVFFGLAQALYTRAFQIRPIGSRPLAASFAIIGLTSYLVATDTMKEGDIATKAFLTVYSVLIVVMAWRATAQFHRNPNAENFCAFLGALSFTISDFCFSLDLFKDSFHMAPFWVMLTYYLAQLGIALSASNSTESVPYVHIVKKSN